MIRLVSPQTRQSAESTLTLIGHLMKDRIKVIKNYGELPKVQCYASQINQVFANILTNAAQAIEETGSISITTYQDESWAVIEVADTGVGIRAEYLDRIFDPGFATKGVGVGVFRRKPGYSFVRAKTELQARWSDSRPSGC